MGKLKDQAIVDTDFDAALLAAYEDGIAEGIALAADEVQRYAEDRLVPTHRFVMHPSQDIYAALTVAAKRVRSLT